VESPRRRSERGGDCVLHHRAPFVRQCQDPHVLVGIDLARQSRDLGPVGLEQDHRRIAAYLAARAEFLRALGIAVEIHGNEKP
jgi:hypothetical protein